jgi:hypothetical protein
VGALSQPPYPPPPPFPPSPQQPPGGAPDRSGRLLGYLLGGLLIGPLLAIMCPIVGVTAGGSATPDGSDTNVPLAVGLIGGLALPLLIPVPLLFSAKTRPWGVGILAGAALTMIVLGGVCAGFIYLLSSSEA